jgi:alkylhydroperoxidase family enzyme
MIDRHGKRMEVLTRRVLASPGALEPEVRAAIAAGMDVPPALVPYITKVVQHAYKVTDEDIVSLREQGFSEDEIFEATVAAALGAGMKRLRAGLVALERSEG